MDHDTQEMRDEHARIIWNEFWGGEKRTVDPVRRVEFRHSAAGGIALSARFAVPPHNAPLDCLTFIDRQDAVRLMVELGDAIAKEKRRFEPLANVEECKQ